MRAAVESHEMGPAEPECDTDGGADESHAFAMPGGLAIALFDRLRQRKQNGFRVAGELAAPARDVVCVQDAGLQEIAPALRHSALRERGGAALLSIQWHIVIGYIGSLKKKTRELA
jgi:hypothetical protein